MLRLRLEVFLGGVLAHEFRNFDAINSHPPMRDHVIEEQIRVWVIPVIEGERIATKLMPAIGAPDVFHKFGIDDIPDKTSWLIVAVVISAHSAHDLQGVFIALLLFNPVVELDDFEGLQKVLPVRVRRFVTKHKHSFLFKGRSVLVLCLPNSIDSIIAYFLEFVQWVLMSVV